MNVNNGVNPVQNNELRAEISVNTGTVSYIREPPPPYTVFPHSQPDICETVIVQQPLKDVPTWLDCPDCHDTVLTKVVYVNSNKTHMLAGFIFGFTMWCMLCCLAAIPYLIPTCQKAQHYCPRCNRVLGSY